MGATQTSTEANNATVIYGERVLGFVGHQENVASTVAENPPSDRVPEALLAEPCAIDFRSLVGVFEGIGRVEDEDASAFLRRTVEEAIRAGRIRPEFQDADEVAQILLGSLHGLVSLQIAKGEDAWVHFRDVRNAAKVARNVLVRGMMR